MFSYAVSLRKWLAHFFLKRLHGEISRNEHTLSQENDGIFHIFCQINFSYQAFSSLHGGSLLTTLPNSFINCIFAQLLLAQYQKLHTILMNTHSIRFKITHISVFPNFSKIMNKYFYDLKFLFLFFYLFLLK